MAVRCARCRRKIRPEESAFAVALFKEGRKISHDVIRTMFLREGVVALHVNGDPDCGRQVSGYLAHLRDELGVVDEIALSFLNEL